MVDTSSLFGLLADARRRQLLLALTESESVEIPSGLLCRSASAGHDEPDPATGGPSPLVVELHHTHLPKLAAAGVVEWDSETDVVTRGPAFEDVAPLVRLLAENPDAVPGDLF